MPRPVGWPRTAIELVEQAARHGAVLFRGFPVSTADDFDAFMGAFDLPNFPYDESLSNAVRVNRTPRVFTANEAPPSVAIYLHHEMAQTPVYPSRLFFFCEQPATEGGATPICRSDVLWERLAALRPSFARDCEEKGLRYTNVMPTENDPGSGMGRGWQEHPPGERPRRGGGAAPRPGLFVGVVAGRLLAGDDPGPSRGEAASRTAGRPSSIN